jgi:hypothetical protein
MTSRTALEGIFRGDDLKRLHREVFPFLAAARVVGNARRVALNRHIAVSGRRGSAEGSPYPSRVGRGPDGSGLCCRSLQCGRKDGARGNNCLPSLRTLGTQLQARDRGPFLVACGAGDCHRRLICVSPGSLMPYSSRAIAMLEAPEYVAGPSDLALGRPTHTLSPRPL